MPDRKIQMKVFIPWQELDRKCLKKKTELFTQQKYYLSMFYFHLVTVFSSILDLSCLHKFLLYSISVSLTIDFHF